MSIPLRLVVAFFAAYGLNVELHEGAHALMADFLGLRATSFQWYVSIDYPPGDVKARVLCAIAGPLFSLCFGILCWVFYKIFKDRAAGLLLLYISIFGISIFWGNLLSTSFVAGDFGVAATLLNLPLGVRLSMTLTGGLLLALFLCRMGAEILKWAVPERNRLRTAVKVIVWPVILGTALSIIAFLPMPLAFIQGWIASSSFWVFAVAGALTAQRRPAATDARDLAPQAIDLAAAVCVVLTARVLALGVHFRP